MWIQKKFYGHEILAMENFVGYLMDMWEFFCCAWTCKNFLWLLWTCRIFDGYGYGKFLVVVSEHVKNFGCGKILVGHRCFFFFFFWDIDFFGGDFLLAWNE